MSLAGRTESHATVEMMASGTLSRIQHNSTHTGQPVSSKAAVRTGTNVLVGPDPRGVPASESDRDLSSPTGYIRRFVDSP